VPLHLSAKPQNEAREESAHASHGRGGSNLAPVTYIGPLIQPIRTVNDDSPAQSDIDLMDDGGYTINYGVHPRLADLETLIADDDCSFWPSSPTEVAPPADDADLAAIALTPFLNRL
jgi:hypothetical protein